MSTDPEAGAGPTQATTYDINKTLINAAKSGNIDTVKKLLNEKNVDINFRDKSAEGKTALMIASQNDFFVIVEQLINEGADVNLATEFSRDRSHIKYEKTALMLASENGHLGIVKQLIKAKAEVDKTNSWGETALFGACAYGDTEIVKTLIIAGAKVNHTSPNGETALFNACRANNHETVRTLIANNANLDVMSENGQSAIMIACLRKHYKCARILIQHDADTRGLSSFEKVMLGVRNLFSRSTKGNQLSPVATSGGEQEEQDPMGAATNATISKKEELNEKISSWFLGISKAELESQLEQETTLTPSAHFGTSSAASGDIEEARNNQHPSMFSATASNPQSLVPLEVESTLTPFTVGTSPAASRRGTETVAPLTQTRQ